MNYCTALAFCEGLIHYGSLYCDVGHSVLFCNGVCICAAVCCVSSVVEYGLFLEPGGMFVYR